MRITENRMIDMASGHISKLRERVARTGEQLSSGHRVSLPSDDPTAWAGARRAEAAQTLNASRGEAVASSQHRLGLVDSALDQIGSALERGRELAVMAANGSMSAEDRALIAAEVNGLWHAVRASANVRSTDGEFLLAGSQTGQPPFDAAGVYQGDNLTRTIETRDGFQQEVSLSGAVLTAASGVDVLAELTALETALNGNDLDGIRATIDTLAAAHQQVSLARGQGGAQSAALIDAELVQVELDHSLEALRSRLIGADPIAAASELAQHSNALEVAQLVATRIIEMTRP
jgi:flagellar hook-associated protein 3 FlgL